MHRLCCGEVLEGVLELQNELNDYLQETLEMRTGWVSFRTTWIAEVFIS